MHQAKASVSLSHNSSITVSDMKHSPVQKNGKYENSCRIEIHNITNKVHSIEISKSVNMKKNNLESARWKI